MNSTRNHNLALLQFDIEFLANFRFTQEISCWENTEITVFLNNLTIFFVYFGILRITCNISLISRSEFLFNIESNLFQIKWLQEFSRSFTQFWSSSTKNLVINFQSDRTNFCTKRFGEASIRLSHQTFEKVQNRSRKVEIFCAFYDLLSVLSRNVIQCHSQVYWRQGIGPSRQQL